jgi:O-antigen/teichoic acid export membrane protein
MKSAFGQTVAYFSTVVVGQLASFILLPLITHYIEPAAYGEYALGLTVAGLIGVLGSASVRNVAFRLYYDAKSGDDRRSFYCNVALLQAVMLCGCYTLVFVAGRGGGLLGISPLTLLASGVATLAGDFYALSISMLRAEKHTWHFVAAEVSSAMIRLAATTVSLRIGLRSPAELFLASALAVGLPGTYAFCSLLSRTSGRIQFRASLLGRVAGLGLTAIPMSLGTWMMALSDRLILQHYASRDVVGIYSAGYSLGDRLISGIVGAVFMMGWPQILEAWTGAGKAAAASAIRSVLRLYLWLTVGPLAFILLYNRQLVAWLTQPAYAGAAEIVPLVAMAAWVAGLVNVALNFVLVPRFGAIGAAVATVIAYIICGIVFLLFTDRSFIRFPHADLAGSLLLAAAAGVVSRLSGAPVGLQFSIFIVLYVIGLAWRLAREAKAGFGLRSIVAQLGGRRS